MSGVCLDGRVLAAHLESALRVELSEIRSRCFPCVPTLAAILVGEDPASATYVRMKIRACERIGLGSRFLHLPEQSTTEQVLECIDVLNADPDVCGILLQHPVPAPINERICFDRIALEKDVDGVTSEGFGRMSLGDPSVFASATPAGIMRLLKHHAISLEGRHAVVVGRSAILGKPMAHLLLQANATVTLCHSYTRDLKRHLQSAEVIVAGLGRPEWIQSDWIADGAAIVDAGYHPQKVGDVALTPELMARCRAYTPVPGGVGPMTIVTLLAHAVEAARRHWDHH